MKDKLARWAIKSEKTAGHDLRRDEGRKSREEDFKGKVLMILKTSGVIRSDWWKGVERSQGIQRMVKDG